MGETAIRKILIVGGGTAGWITAAALSALYAKKALKIELVESEAIGTVGVGEATVPHIRFFNDRIGVDERAFMLKTAATFKLGIEFRDWGRIGDSYVHPFGDFGRPVGGVKFHQLWRRLQDSGAPGSIFDYSLPVRLATQGRFAKPSTETGAMGATYSYAYQFDASLYAAYLRELSVSRGVTRHEGRITQVVQDPISGFVQSVALEDGRRLEADLFIDCSGFRGLLIEETLKSGYEDWSQWLPCDRAWAAPCAAAEPGGAYTRATAREAGWQWRIPLQHRVGNGYVYSSANVSDTDALDDLLAKTGEKPLADPRFLRFVTGRRKRFWNRNCVALGLASGFLEPLESTSIHLVMSSVYNLLDRFPDKSFDQSNIDAYNRELIDEIEHIRDFIVLHYCTTQRNDAPLWSYCQSMSLPDSLLERIEIYKGTGRVRPKAGELFTDLSWFYIFEGMGVEPRGYDPLADVISDGQLRGILGEFARATAASVKAAPSHDSYFPAPLDQAATRRLGAAAQ